MVGLSLTSSSLIPVSSYILSDIGISGLTSVWNFSVITPFTILIAPISVILSYVTSVPVVSISTTVYGPFNTSTGITSFLVKKVSCFVTSIFSGKTKEYLCGAFLDGFSFKSPFSNSQKW